MRLNGVVQSFELRFGLCAFSNGNANGCVGLPVTIEMRSHALPTVLNAIFGTLLLTGPVSEGPERALHLVWDAPRECPGEEDVRAAVDDLVGPYGDGPPGEHLVAEAELRRKGDAWSMRLRVETESGVRSRELSAPTCDELASVAAVVIAVAIDPSPVGLDTPTNASSISDRPAATTPSTPPPIPAPIRGTLRGAITLGGAFGVGALPGPTGAFAGAGALVWPYARWELGATAWVPRSRRFGTNAEAEIGAWHVDTRGCGVPTARRVEFPLCLGIELGAMTGRGRGLPHTARQRLPWVAIEASAMVLAPVNPHLSVFMTTRLVVPVLRPGFTLDRELVHRTTVVAFAAVVGLEVRWRWLDAGRDRARLHIAPPRGGEPLPRLASRISRVRSNIRP